MNLETFEVIEYLEDYEIEIASKSVRGERLRMKYLVSISEYVITHGKEAIYRSSTASDIVRFWNGY